MPDLRDTLDALQEDMRDHELRFVGEVHASRNQALAVQVVEQLERELADRPPPAAPPAPAPPPAPGREVREGQHGRYIVDSVPSDDIRVRPATAAEAWFMAHAMARVELLLTKLDTGLLGQPSWRDRVLAVMELRSRVPGLKAHGHDDAAADLEKRFTFELMALLEESNRVFGDWKADPSPRIQVG